MAITIDAQTGNVCAVTDTVANVVQAISENCAAPSKDVLGFIHDGTNVTVFFVKTK